MGRSRFSYVVVCSLNTGLLAEDQVWLESLVQTLTEPVRNLQDKRLTALGTTGSKEIEKQIRIVEKERDAFFGAAPVRNPQTEARFASKIQELRQLQFVSLIVENPAPGMLLKAATRSRGSLLAVYHDSMIQSLLAARKKGALDLEFLSRAWECKTMDAGTLRAGPPSVRPVMGALFNCNQTTLHGAPGRTVLTTAGSHASHPASFRCPRVRVSARPRVRASRMFHVETLTSGK